MLICFLYCEIVDITDSAQGRTPKESVWEASGEHKRSHVGTHLVQVLPPAESSHVSDARLTSKVSSTLKLTTVTHHSKAGEGLAASRPGYGEGGSDGYGGSALRLLRVLRISASSSTTLLRNSDLQKPTFASLRWQLHCLGWSCGRSRSAASAVPVSTSDSTFYTDAWNQQARDARLQHLEAQAIEALKKTVDNFEKPAFPCALIAGDVVILDLLNWIGALSAEKVKIIFIDTFHLFSETHQFLVEVEKQYGFKAHTFHAAGVNNKEEYDAKFGSDLFITDVEEYDRICKVEPFSRALKTLDVNVMINGRRRDHGAERAHLEVFEAGKMIKVQPLAYWEFRDCWDYLKYSLPYHPLHDQGFPSIGDVQSTIPVSRDKWFEYAGERSGRFQGLRNPDGSEKTECGIHVGGYM